MRQTGMLVLIVGITAALILLVRWLDRTGKQLESYGDFDL